MVSNRVPSAEDLDPARKGAGAVGGLVSAVRASLLETGGAWFGWSGFAAAGRPRSDHLGAPEVTRNPGPVELATIDLTEVEADLYYDGFSNRTLWPLLHSFIERAQIRHDAYHAYRRVNHLLAQALISVLREDDLVWVHDYHMIPIAEELRRLGWNGRLGFFLHTPFPGADVFSVLPWARDLLYAMLSFDLIGVHTRRYMLNLVDAFRSELGGDWNGQDFAYRGRAARLGVYPIGIDPEPFRLAARESPESLPGMLGLDAETRIIIGVDRLDYTKGIPHRLRSFSKMLEDRPGLHGKVVFVQISNPSRADVPEYVRERETVERLVGEINGRYSEGGWVPVRYLYRYFSQQSLAAFYRDADVNMVTPLRDGMNLIAKEFVASQVRDPGALILSGLAGAAAELSDAIIVNPFDTDGMAQSLYDALQMPRDEREARWRRMNDAIIERTASWWSAAFTSDLRQTTKSIPP